ncbi:MAG: ABC transporter substrate-binding protein [Nitrospira sp.]
MPLTIAPADVANKFQVCCEQDGAQMTRGNERRTVGALLLVWCWIVMAPLPSSAQGHSRMVTDMAGRAVSLPPVVERVAAVGSVPVIHSFIFTMGKADTIVNGLPLFAQGKRYDIHRLFAPKVATQPTTQGPGGEPDMERLLELKPQVVFVMDKMLLNMLERKGFTVVFLAWRQPDDVRTLMTLLGHIFHREERAAAYLEWFDETVRRVQAGLHDHPQVVRPRVLFASMKSMRSPHLIGDWWIQQAGGVSVTADGRESERFDFSIEHMIQWNPDVLIVNDPGEVEQVYKDQRSRYVKAVQAGRVFSIPVGAHPWGYRTAEQPLMVIWAANRLYGDGFAGLNLMEEMQQFYRRFFNVQLTDDQLRMILNGGA